MTRAPAAVGQRVEEIDTPALLLDLDAFEANLATRLPTAQAESLMQLFRQSDRLDAMPVHEFIELFAARP